MIGYLCTVQEDGHCSPLTGTVNACECFKHSVKVKEGIGIDQATTSTPDVKNFLEVLCMPDKPVDIKVNSDTEQNEVSLNVSPQKRC